MRIRMIFAGLTLAALVACGGSEKQDTMIHSTKEMPKKSLYERLGGKEAITKVVDLFVSKVGADARVNAFFANTDLDKLKAHLVDQICDVASAGTQCTYTGRTMEEAHRGLHITQEQFDAVVEDLVAAMKELGVGDAEQQEILGVLGPMSKQMVEI